MSGRASSLGFGFIPDESGHHFLVWIPRSNKADAPVHMTEHLTWTGDADDKALTYATTGDDLLRVTLPRAKWDAIADAVRAEFNARLRETGMRAGKWKIGKIPLSRLFGKELVLLAWAIEDADPSLIVAAIQNWRGLTPEERWWLYTMTSAATGRAIQDRGKGWRRAVRYALTENPVSIELAARPRFQLFAPDEAS